MSAAISSEKTSPCEALSSDSVRTKWTYSESLGILLISGLAALLRLWRIDLNGTGNPYYAAAVRSMLVSFNNFFFGSFDPAGFITVDKPPAALWVQAISARLFGYSGRSLLVPQALMGVATVLVVYVIVRRISGIGPALLAAFVLAITPIGVAVDRDNLPDSLLTLLLVLAAWALSHSIESGRLRSLLISVALVGMAFNVKMLAAFVVLPTFYLVYLFQASAEWKKRFQHLVLATVVLTLVSLSWCLTVEVIPKNSRPYIGGSRSNSALDLALGYNGLGRVFGGSGNMRPPGRGMGPGNRPFDGAGPGRPDPWDGRRGNPARRASPADTESAQGPTESNPNRPAGDQLAETTSPKWDRPDDRDPDFQPGFFPGGPFPGGPFPGGPPGMGPPDDPASDGSADGNAGRSPGRRRGPTGPGMRGPMFGGPPGLLRFTLPLLAEQITWLFPVAIFGAFATLLQTGLRGPASPLKTALLVWTGWLGTHWMLFSLAQGIFHEYYTVILGPALAVLAGIGVMPLWKTLTSDDWRISLLPSALVATGLWQTYLIGQYPEFRYGLLPLVLGGICGAVTMIVARNPLSLRWPAVPWGTVGSALALAFGLIAPLIWSVGTSITPGMSVMPVADVSGITGSQSDRPRLPPFESNPRSTLKLIEFLQKNRKGEKYLVAANSSMEVSPIIIQTGEAAISLGGFMGADPVLTKEQFQELVESKQLRFFLVGGGPGGGGPPPGMGQGGPFGPPSVALRPRFDAADQGLGTEPAASADTLPVPAGTGSFPDGSEGFGPPDRFGPPGFGPPGGFGPPRGGPGGPMGNPEIMSWIREHGKVVDPDLWQHAERSSDTDGPPRGFGPRRGPQQLYDLRPDEGLASRAEAQTKTN